MEFTIYTLGDIESFAAGLTGVAMIFNPDNSTGFASDVGIGLGSYWALSMMIALTVALFKGIMSLKFELGELIMVTVLYFILFVPKFDVILEDYYTGQIAAVDDVPLGIALPGSFISGITVDISETLGTAYRVATAEAAAVPDMKNGGYVSPLRILNSIRDAGTKFIKKDPNLSQTIYNLYIDCAFGRPGYDVSAGRASTNPIEALLTYTETINGITEIYTPANPTGVASTCIDASSYVRDSKDQVFGVSVDSDATRNPNGVTVFSSIMCASPNVMKQSTGGCPEYDDYKSAFEQLAFASGADARAFAETTMFSQILLEAANCAPVGANGAAIAQCAPFVSALEQYKEDAVAGGSMFQRTMSSSMSVFQFLFYAFAPIVSILMVVMGAKGIKLLGSYMLFGVWTQSWLPFATIIHFYIQVKTSTDLARFGASRELVTGASYQEFYQQISLSLASASDLLAATPIMTLALLSGSIFALTGVATRMSGRDHYDESVNTPALVSNGPVAQNLTAYQGNQGYSLSQSGLAPGQTMELSSNTAYSQGMLLKAGQSAIQNTTKGVASELKNIATTSSSLDEMTSRVYNNGFAQSKTEAAMIAGQLQDAQAKKTGTDKRSGASSETSASESKTGTTSGGLSPGGLFSGIASKIVSGLGANIGVQGASNSNESNASKMENRFVATDGSEAALSKSNTATGSTSDTAVRSMQKTLARAQAIRETMQSQNSEGLTEATTSAFQAADASTREFSAGYTSTISSARKMQLDADAFTGMLATEPTGAMQEDLQELRESLLSTKEGRAALAAQESIAASTQAGTKYNANLDPSLQNGRGWATYLAAQTLGGDAAQRFNYEHLFSDPALTRLGDEAQRSLAPVAAQTEAASAAVDGRNMLSAEQVRSINNDSALSNQAKEVNDLAAGSTAGVRNAALPTNDASLDASYNSGAQAVRAIAVESKENVEGGAEIYNRTGTAALTNAADSLGIVQPSHFSGNRMSGIYSNMMAAMPDYLAMQASVSNGEMSSDNPNYVKTEEMIKMSTEALYSDIKGSLTASPQEEAAISKFRDVLYDGEPPKNPELSNRERIQATDAVIENQRDYARNQESYAEEGDQFESDARKGLPPEAPK